MEDTVCRQGLFRPLLSCLPGPFYAFRPLSGLMAVLCLCCGLLQAGIAQAEEVFFHRPRPTVGGQVEDFEEALIRLALDRTVAAEGPYRLMKGTPESATTRRAEQDLRRRVYPGQIVALTATADLMRDLIYIRFPVDSGITGLRLALTSASVAQKTVEIRTFADLSHFTSVQGLGWQDVSILRRYGLRVEEMPSRDSLARMVARGRADFYWRGINEVARDLRLATENSVTGLQVAPGIALFYPLPKLFFAHPADATHLRRLERGLMAVWADGSFHALWRRYYAETVAAVSFEGRTVFHLSNPDTVPVQEDLRRFELPEMTALRSQGRWVTVQSQCCQRDEARQ